MKVITSHQMKPLHTNPIVLTLATVGLLLKTTAAAPMPTAPQTPPAGSAPQATGAPGRADAPAAQPGQVPGGRGGGGLYPALEADDTTGFVSIFDGKTLNGWDGDPTFWRVENGVIVGETTAEKVVKVNNFLIWRGGTVKDFELKVEFRLSGTNSGIQYRSVELPDIGKWVLKGYQADMDFAEGFVGNVHDERGRSPVGEGHVVLSKRGQMTRIIDGPAYKLVGTIGDRPCFAAS